MQSVLQQVWEVADFDEEKVLLVSSALSIPPALARILAGRGVTDAESAEKFLNPRLSDMSDPFLQEGMEKAVTRIWSAIEKGEPITVYGDFDADGITSTAVMIGVLDEIGADVSYCLANRFKEGYGLSEAVVDDLIDQNNPKLIITVDCGTNAVNAVSYAASKGVDIIITDHHEPSGEVACSYSLINPKLDSKAPGQELAGVGVAFKLCHGLVKSGMSGSHAELLNKFDLRKYLDLVAIGTVADIVPMIGENRIIVKHGLKLLQNTDRPGLKALMTVAGCKGTIRTYHIGFLIGPRINAAGRLGAPETALRLLVADNASDAIELSKKLDDTNKERKKIEDNILKDALSIIDEYFDENAHFGIVTGKDGWHIGTIGIVASRLCARYSRPSVVVSFDESGKGRGSCRSVGNVNIFEILNECSDLLNTYGGHKMAAGLEIDRENFEKFQERFNKLCLSSKEKGEMQPVLKIDSWVTLGEADSALFSSVDSLRPFGIMNPTPIFAAKDLRPAGPPKRVGKKEEHVKLVLASGATQIDAIAFNMSERDFESCSIDVAFQLQENEYMGRTSLQMSIKEIRPSQKQQEV